MQNETKSSLVNAMTTVAPDNTVAARGCVLLDDRAHVAVLHPRLHTLRDRLLQALPRVHHKVLRLLRHLTHKYRFIQVPMVAPIKFIVYRETLINGSF